MKKLAFSAACFDFFGLKQGQSRIEFMKELKNLDDTDRQYFRQHFPSVGYEIV